ncbi:MAG: molybdenum cofactor guanylyltransferase MobA [Thiohalomonadaceae bacterium]
MTTADSTHNNITGVILAGGGGRRMGGEDKGLLTLRGKTLVQHVIDRLAPQCQNLLINCNRNQQAYADFHYPLISDSMPGGLGPLAGLLSAMAFSQTALVLSIPCDTPALPLDLVARMLNTLQESHADVCTVSDGERLHPVILLAHCRLQSSLSSYLESGSRKVHDWFYNQAHAIADFSDQPDAFTNLNTPQQLQEAERRSTHA